MEWWQPLLLAGVGIVAGWLNVMAGGGSMLTVPTMLFLGLPGPVANGTNRIAIIAQNIVAVTTFFRRGHADLRLSLSLALAALPGAIAGAAVGTQLDGVWFNRTLAATMLGVMVLMARGRSRRDPVTTARPGRARLVWGHVLMLGAGFWGGFIQIGVGFILMPILHRVIGLDLVRTNMHKVFIVLVFSVAALAVFASRVEIYWAMGLALAAGNALGGWLGAHTTISKGETVIRGVLYAALIAIVVRLLLFD